MDMEEQLAQAMESLRTQHARIDEVRRELEQRSTTVESKNKSVEATVDASGRLTALRFRGNRYRSLAPAELAALVVETVTSAQTQAQRDTMSAATGLMPEGLSMFEGLGDEDGNFDPEAAMRQFVQAAGTWAPDDPAATATSEAQR